MVILSSLESLPTHIVTLPLTSLCSFCNSCFELLILATEPVSNTEGLLMNTSKVHINNLYIKYTFCSLCHPSYPPNTWGSSASSDQSLCSRSTQFQAQVQTWASSLEQQLACCSSCSY